MKISSFILTFASAFGGCASLSAAEGPPVADFLQAIRQVETGDRYDAPNGRHGEVGPYQFRRQVWRRYTRAPLADARTSLADVIAARHYAWLKTRLESAGMRPTAWNLAAAWNGGIGSVSSGRIPRTTRDYARRVQNLVGDEAVLRASFTPHFQISVADAGTIPIVPISP